MLAYRLNGFWFDENEKIVSLDEVVNRIQYTECFIKKAVESWGGLGVVYYNPQKNTPQDLKNIVQNIPCDLVIQAKIIQSKTLAIINPDSVNTIRHISLLDCDGKVKIYSSVLRMGIKGAVVDNATSGGISTGIKEDGRLKDVAFSNGGVKYAQHPTSGVHFEDYVIPNYEKMKELVIKLHPMFPHFRLISWDFAVDEFDEPILIEANLCNGELDFHQLNNGPLFGEDTEKVLSEVFANHK